MHVAIYARVSTMRQAQAQTTDQQLDRLGAHAERQGWALTVDASSATTATAAHSLRRPGRHRRATLPRVPGWTAS